MKTINRSNANFEALWKMLWEDDFFQHSCYLPSYVEYYKEYSRNIEFQDYSFIIENQGKPVIGVGLTADQSAGSRRRFSFFGQPVFYLFSVPQEGTLYKLARRLLKDELLRIFKESTLETEVIYRDALKEGALSFLGEYFLTLGAKATPHFSQMIDLSLSEAQLSHQIRKSYKSLINWGKNNLDIVLLTSDNITTKDIEQFRQLHIREAGRETRSERTWQIQYERVKGKEAFVMFGKLGGELVTAGFFSYSSKSCYYGSSASKRDLFDKPLLHALVWEAMLYAKDAGCRYFETGQQFYGENTENSTEKDVNISTFKRGFGGRPWVSLNIHLEASFNEKE